MTRQGRGLFDEEYKLRKLTMNGDPLEKLNAHIHWEIFHKPLEKVLKNDEKDESKGGRPAYDAVLLFKILILQRMYNLSDHQTEYQINDRLSFMRFLGLDLSDTVPDEKTIWLFREKLAKDGIIDRLYETFQRQLMKEGVLAQNGSIVDATFVDVPKQRNTKDENKDIKNGKTPESFEQNATKKRQKDMDARWVTKNKERHYGYKNHIKIDKGSKLITAYTVTDAAVHDSQALDTLLTTDDAHHDLFGDSAYSGAPLAEIVRKKNIRNKIHEKGYRGNPLTTAQKERNRKKSRTRSRVEHVFAFIEGTLKGSFIRCIGIVRARMIIGLTNLCYNIRRYLTLRAA